MDPGSIEIYYSEIERGYLIISSDINFFVSESDFSTELKFTLVSEMICFFKSFNPLDERLDTLYSIANALVLKSFIDDSDAHQSAFLSDDNEDI